MFLCSSVKDLHGAQAGSPGPRALLHARSPGPALRIWLHIYSARFLCFPGTNQRVVHPCSGPSLDHACLASRSLFQGTRHGWREVHSLITFSITAPASLPTLGPWRTVLREAQGAGRPVFSGRPGKGTASVFCPHCGYFCSPVRRQEAGGAKHAAWHCGSSRAPAVGKILACSLPVSGPRQYPLGSKCYLLHRGARPGTERASKQWFCDKERRTEKVRLPLSWSGPRLPREPGGDARNSAENATHVNETRNCP